MVLQDATPLKGFFGGLLLGTVLVGIIFQLTRGTASQQDPASDPLLDPVVENEDPTQDNPEPTLPDDASTSTADSIYQGLGAFIDKHRTRHLS
jgi:hypothetical protein